MDDHRQKNENVKKDPTGAAKKGPIDVYVPIGCEGIPSDILGSYTGLNQMEEIPEQDADDL